METDVTKAINLFIAIKTALSGSQPEWRLPRVDDKAKESEPKLGELQLSQECQIIG